MLEGQGQVYYQDVIQILDDRIEVLEKELEKLSQIVLIQGIVIGGIIGTLLAWRIFKII